MEFKQGFTGLKILFGEDTSKWQYSKPQLSYVTPYYISRKIAELAAEYYPNKNTIWDMFSGIGMDAIQLASFFSVYTTEIDQDIYNIQRKNITSLNLEHKINTTLADCYTCIETINSDIIFLDPCWGSEYRSNVQFSFKDVYLSNGVSVPELFLYILKNKTKNIIIKSPIKCDTFEELIESSGVDMTNYNIQKFLFTKHKLKFIFIYEKNK